MESKTILIVEDNTVVAEECRNCLENYGYSVTSIVASGEESLERAALEKPDVILMDIRLRDEMDGIQAAQKINDQFKIPVVFLSAYGDRELLNRARKVESYGFLIKPYEERELFATLEMALYKAQIEKERKIIDAKILQTHKMQLIGALAGGIAHQFNNSLAVVAGNVELLRLDFPDDANIAQYAIKIKTPVDRMARLTAQLLAFARGGKYLVKRVLISDFMSDTIPLIQHTISPLIRVEFNFSCNTCYVDLDISQMQMVISAILTNASEAIEHKGTIKLSCRSAIVGENSEKTPGLKPGKYAVLVVTDNGSGMDKKTLDHIFDPFFSTKFQGRGLGMAAVYGVIKNHDGWISVDSEPDIGTMVELFLPSVDVPDEVKLEEPPPEKKIVTGNGTILVIEDESMVMAVCRAMLETLGYHVLEAKTGSEAIEMVVEMGTSIDLAILDILLPDMGGQRVYPLLQEACPGLKVLVCSGYSINGPATEIIEAGAQDFLQKPYTLTELSGKLQKILNT